MNEEQAERVRRAQKVNGYPVEQALVQLGLVNEVQIAQALAAESGLPYVKINPLDLDIDVLTRGRSNEGPRGRRTPDRNLDLHLDRPVGLDLVGT